MNILEVTWQAQIQMGTALGFSKGVAEKQSCNRMLTYRGSQELRFDGWCW